MNKNNISNRFIKYAEAMRSSWLDDNLVMGVTHDKLEKFFTKQQFDRFLSCGEARIYDFDTERVIGFYYLEDILKFIDEQC